LQIYKKHLKKLTKEQFTALISVFHRKGLQNISKSALYCII